MKRIIIKRIVLIILVFISIYSYADNKGPPYTDYTVDSGEWTNNDTWNKNAPTLGEGNDITLTIKSGHDIVYNPGSNPWVWPQNKINIIIESGASLTFNTNLDIQNNFTFTVQDGGELTINGNISMDNNADGEINGSVYVTGNLSVGLGNTLINGTGELIVDGTISDPGENIDEDLIIGIDRYFKAVSGNWSDASNWSTEADLSNTARTAPNSQCDVFISNYNSISRTCYVDIDVACYSLDIESGSNLIINTGINLSVTNSTLIRVHP